MKKHSTLFIGLDTHKDSTVVAYATDSRTEPVTYLGAIGTQHYGIRKMVRQFESRNPKCQLQLVYEAGLAVTGSTACSLAGIIPALWWHRR